MPVSEEEGTALGSKGVTEEPTELLARHQRGQGSLLGFTP